LPLYPLYFVLVQFVVIFIEVLMLAMTLRAILGWFFDGDGKFIRFLYVFTEPAIMPLRKLFYKLNWFQDVPIDISFSATYIVLMLVQIFLGSTLN
jgi:uncharacterized protein YggT (Ycf19 family)